MTGRRGPAVWLAGLAALLMSGTTARSATLELRTAPPVAGVRFSIEGTTAVSGPDGRVALPVQRWQDLPGRIAVDGTHLGAFRRARLVRWSGNLARPSLARRVRAVLEVSAPVPLRFTDPRGRRVDPGRIAAVRLVSSQGRTVTLRGRGSSRLVWLPVTRVRSVPFGSGLQVRPVSYVVRNVVVDGVSVVHRGQQRFTPRPGRPVTVRLLFFALHVRVADALLGVPIGSHVVLTGPDGRARRFALGSGASLDVPALPRGDYTVTADAPGLSRTRSVALSRDTEVSLRVVSDLDLALVMLTGGLLLLGLAAARRALRGRAPAPVVMSDGPGAVP